MPKAPRVVKVRHDPLHVDLEQDDSLQKFGRVSRPGRRKGKAREEDEGNDEDGPGEDARMSRKILDLARDQQDEVAREAGLDEEEESEEELFENKRTR